MIKIYYKKTTIMFSLFLISLLLFNYANSNKNTIVEVSNHDDTDIQASMQNTVTDISKKNKIIISPEQKNQWDMYHYRSNSLSIDIEPIVKINPNIKYWITHVKINSPNQLKTTFGHDNFMAEREKTSEITSRNQGILGINASAFFFDTNKPSGIIIQKGKILAEGYGTPLCIKRDGTFYIPTSGKTGKELIQQGVKHTFTFGPILINNGEKIPITFGSPNGSYPRTAIGQVSINEYYIITADGKRPGYSIGLTTQELQDLLFDRGATIAYNLDGGGSTTLYFNGRLVNSPSDETGERSVANIIYFTK
ncbi:phosphodiester glycosidase family protein [Clostridium sp. SHJSY1]|uniref:phosphodiester glycosidase family protein n=1 Tax=Clostridium sp. SHJSY1 TaxID=2942483 RepID=UPI0028744A09|nr:phosphodiester glycosidase family protein [Clostridium sp. SHJSY1]MDS0527149.1 phosphodiester glycosidase family protein [Clostridium sp. SHJSY1]